MPIPILIACGRGGLEMLLIVIKSSNGSLGNPYMIVLWLKMERWL